MPSVPLGLGSYKRRSAFGPEVELINFYLEEDKSGASPDNVMRLQRPGLQSFIVMPQRVRALYRSDGVIGGAQFALGLSALYRLSGGVAEQLGTVDTGTTGTLVGTKFGLFVLSAGKVWRYDGSAIDALSIPESRFVVDLCTLDGFLVIACGDGRFYWLRPGATEIDPLDFATAESSADGLVACESMGGEFYLFGPDSVEPWQPTGDGDAPFQRAGGRLYQRGCMAAAAVVKFDNALVWVGDDGVVYRADAVPMRLSEHGIEERLCRRTGPPEAWTFATEGHRFYVLRIPGEGTFAYDASTQAWSEFASEGATEWRAVAGIETRDGSLAADAATGDVWRLVEGLATDNGQMMRRVATATLAIVGKPPRNDSATIVMGSADDCTVALDWRDGRDDWPVAPEVLEVRAPADAVTIYRLGIPDQPYRTMRVTVIDPVAVRLSGLVVNEAWQ